MLPLTAAGGAAGGGAGGVPRRASSSSPSSSTSSALLSLATLTRAARRVLLWCTRTRVRALLLVLVLALLVVALHSLLSWWSLERARRSVPWTPFSSEHARFPVSRFTAAFTRMRFSLSADAMLQHTVAADTAAAAAAAGSTAASDASPSAHRERSVLPRFARVGKRAFVTLMTPTAGYVNSTIAFAFSLLVSGSGARYPLVVLVRPREAVTLRERFAAETRVMENMGVTFVWDESVPFERTVVAADVNLDFPHWQQAYGKLAIWALDQYERLFYLDGDQVVLGDLGSVFREFAESEQVSSGGIASVLDPMTYPCPGRDRLPYLLSSAIVLKPDVATFDALVDQLGVDADKNWRWWDGDQQLIFTHFRHNAAHLPSSLSYFPVECECTARGRRREADVIHYTWSPKPFQADYSAWMLERRSVARRCMELERTLWQWYVALGTVLYADGSNVRVGDVVDWGA